MNFAIAGHTNGSDIDVVVLGNTVSVRGCDSWHVGSFFVTKDFVDGAQLCLQVILSLTQRRTVSFGDCV
jgi:hypothetical protein